MRVLIPDTPEFKSLNVEGLELLPYRRGETPPQNAQGLVLWGLPRLERGTLLAQEGLEWVLTLTAGVDHVLADVPAHVRLYNASPIHDEAVAQHAVALMLGAGRRLHVARDRQRTHTWGRLGDMWTLAGKHVVIWGYGHIGRAVERLLLPFGASVTGLRSSTSPEDVNEALRAADVLLLLLPSTPHTRGALNAERLALLPHGAWVANLGRGELIVTADLIHALESGRLGGAMLDVTDPEPLPEDSPLWALENVIITPHVASTTTDMLARGAQYAHTFLQAVARGEDLPGLVPRDRGY